MPQPRLHVYCGPGRDRAGQNRAKAKAKNPLTPKVNKTTATTILVLSSFDVSASVMVAGVVVMGAMTRTGARAADAAGAAGAAAIVPSFFSHATAICVVMVATHIAETRTPLAHLTVGAGLVILVSFICRFLFLPVALDQLTSSPA